MIDTIAAFDGRLAKVEGAERSGKTQALVARCAHLIQNGEAPASILVAVTNAFAAQAFRKRLRRALPANLIGAALSVRVCTALDAAVSALDQPAAREATGRVPRILNSAEYNFFLEDLKTIGEQPRKLRSMLGFLDRKMAGYEPREEWNAGTAADNLLASATPIERAAGAEGLPQGVQSIKWNTPEDELNGLTKYLRKLLDGQEDAREANTCVVVPNRRWAVMVEKMLRRRGFNVSAAGAAGTLAGDPRDSTRSRALVAYTKLGLLADPTDMIAWRSWCGFDNALTNSDAWMGLQDFAEAEGLTLYQALQQVGSAGFGAKEPFLRARTLAEKWRSGQDFLEKNATRRGFGLMKAIGAEGISEFEAVAADMVGDETAKTLLELEQAAISDPAWTEDPHVVHICLPQNLCGTEYDNMFVVGCIDGFFPQRNAFEVVSTDGERNRIMDAERRDFMGGVAKAKHLLVLSHFSKAELELAERTKMQVVRVKSENGKRMAIVRPSCFLREAGDAAPTTMGGQALLAEYGLN